MVTQHLKLGERAEQQACQFLKAQGLKLIEKNWHYYTGEIDLIMQDDDDIVFVEVRYRTNINYGKPIETISQSKRKKIIKTALCYLQRKKWLNRSCRFDVVSIYQEKLEWIKHAFTAD